MLFILKLFFKTGISPKLDGRQMKSRMLSKLWWNPDSNSVLPLEPNSTLLPLARVVLATSKKRKKKIVGIKRILSRQGK